VVRRPTTRRIKCASCGADVAATSNSQKFCAPCGREIHRKRNRDRGRAQRGPRPKIPCARCGIEITKTRDKRKYCAECATIVVRERSRIAMRKKYVPVPKVEKECAWCASKFLPENSHSIYCSHACKEEGQRSWNRFNMRRRRAETNTRPDTCVDCGEPISQPLTNVRTRCDICLREYRRGQSAQWNTKKRERRIRELRAKGVFDPRKCPECRRTFVPEYNPAVIRKVLCSKECTLRFHDRLQKQKRRARTAGAEIETVIPQTVFEVCDWTCQHCGRRLDPDLYGTKDRRAPELDHIVPLSLGGDHLYSNCQLLCKLCNGKKRNTFDPAKEFLRRVINAAVFNPEMLDEIEMPWDTAEGKS
jgi:hypothetical protein